MPESIQRKLAQAVEVQWESASVYIIYFKPSDDQTFKVVRNLYLQEILIREQAERNPQRSSADACARLSALQLAACQ